MLPWRSILSLRLTEIFIVFNPTAPRHVSDTRIYLHCLFTESLSVYSIVETSCTSEYPFVSETGIGSERHLRYIPVMITRLMLSLKKEVISQEPGWSLGEPSMHTTMKFAERRGEVSAREEICLDTFASVHEGTQSQT